MKTRLGLHLFLLIVCGSTITAMDQRPDQQEKSHQPRRNELFTVTSDLDAALQKRLEVNEKDTVIHCYQCNDIPYSSIEETIKKISPAVNPSKPYILFCVDFRHPQQDMFNCDMFDVTQQQWIQGTKIKAHGNKDIEILVPSSYSRPREGGKKYYPYAFKPDMNNSLFAIINMHDLDIAPDLCGKLAQGLRARGIPVVFNIQKALSDLLFSSEAGPFSSYSLSLLLKEPESYETDTKQADQKITGSTIEKSQPQSHRFIPSKKNKQKGISFFTDKILLIGGFSAAFIAFLCYIHSYAK